MQSRSIVLRRSYVTTLTVPNTGAGAGLWLNFSPESTSNFNTDFGGTFELVRAIRGDVSYVPTFNVLTLASGSALSIPPIYTAYSPGVASAPASEAAILQYGTCKVHTPSLPWRRGGPCVLANSLNSGFSYPMGRDTWYSVGSSPQVNGLLVWIDGFGQAANTQLGTLIVTVTFALSNPF